MKYVYSSSNKNKFKELKSLFPHELEHHPLDLIEIQENHQGIVESKVREAHSKLQDIFKQDFMVIVDDVSLEIKDLNGFPGPYIKYFLNIGLNKLEIMLENFKKEATVYCGLGVAYWSKAENCTVYKVFIGACEGEIIFNRQHLSKYGFGFDSIFRPLDSEKTFGEMDVLEKNVCSHRGKAVQKLIHYLDEIEKS